MSQFTRALTGAAATAAAAAALCLAPGAAVAAVGEGELLVVVKGTKVTVTAVHDGRKDTVCTIILYRDDPTHGTVVHGVKVVRAGTAAADGKRSGTATFAKVPEGSELPVYAECFDSDPAPTGNWMFFDAKYPDDFEGVAVPAAARSVGSAAVGNVSVGATLRRNGTATVTAYHNSDLRTRCHFTVYRDNFVSGNYVGTSIIQVKDVAARNGVAKFATRKLPAGGQFRVQAFCYDSESSSYAYADIGQ